MADNLQNSMENAEADNVKDECDFIKIGDNRKDENGRERDDNKDRGRDRDRNRRGDKRKSDRDFSNSNGPRKRGARTNNRVFITNIPYEFKWQELKDLFRTEVGDVSFSQIYEDTAGKSRGCGIVEFDSPRLLKLALDKMHRFDLKGRKLSVKDDSGVERDDHGYLLKQRARSRERRDDYFPRRDDGPPASRFDGPPASRFEGPPIMPDSSQEFNTYGLNRKFLAELGIDGPLGARVFVANLDYKVDDTKLNEVFSLAGKVINAEVVKDREGKSRGFGVVEMDHPIRAVQAISMFNNQMLFDRKMTVRMDRIEKQETRSAKLPEGLRGIGMGLGAEGKPLHDVPFDSGSRMTPQAIVPPLNVNGLANLPALTNVINSLSSSDLSRLVLPGLQGIVPNAPLAPSAANLGQGPGQDGGRGPQSQGFGNGYGGPGSAAYGYSTDMNRSGSGPVDYDRDRAGPPRDRDREREPGRDPFDLYRSGGGGGGGGGAGYPGDSYAPNRGDNRVSGPAPSGFDSPRMGGGGAGNGGPIGGGGAMQGPGMRMGAGPGMPGAGRPKCELLVNNLPMDCLANDLLQKFRSVGDVLEAKILQQGTGYVRMGSERDASRALSMLTNSRMNNRNIDICFY